MIDASYMAQLQQRQAALESDLANPELASQVKRYRALMEEHAYVKDLCQKAQTYHGLLQEIEGHQALLDDPETDSELAALAREELTTLKADLPRAEREWQVALLPPSPDDSRDTILEIRAGTGGEEAALFAGDLYRMYVRYAENQGWKTNIITANPSSRGGFKEIIFAVEGQQVYRTLKFESGGHRVQRIPITEAGGRIHTSAATVAVLADADDVDEIELRPEDLRVDIFRSSGPGGQSVNTTDSAVRLTHLPTQLVVTCQDEKSQHRNKDKAMRVLRARLLDLKRQEEADRTADERRTQIGSGDRSQRIRTYNFPQNRLTDHRINLTLYNLDRIITGELDELIAALDDYDREQRLRTRMQTSA